MGYVIIVDDDDYIRDVLADHCRRLNHEADVAGTLAEGLDLLGARPADLVFLDVRLPDGNGLDALPRIRKQSPSSPEVIIITGAAEDEGAAMAIKSGAWDYIQKPLSKQEIILQIRRAFEYRAKMQQPRRSVLLKAENIYGSSPQLRSCLEIVAQCAPVDANVLITGETGTGKELFARAIHESSPRSGRNFVVVDCGALPENLVESILFGHEKGAFTGADKAKEGLIGQAHGGTLFLDEVGELPLSIQRSFLRVLQERSYRPVGGTKELKSDFRVIAATNRNLDEMAVAGRFRKDLVFRLRSIVMELPPLRGRTGDILDLFMYYMRKICDRYGVGIKGFSPEFLEALLAYDWPGNVRELIHALERAIAAARDEPTLYRLHLPAQIRIHLAQACAAGRGSTPKNGQEEHQSTPVRQTTLNEALQKVEREYLERLLISTGGCIKEACRISGLSRTRLYERLRRYGLQKRPDAGLTT